MNHEMSVQDRPAPAVTSPHDRRRDDVAVMLVVILIGFTLIAAALQPTKARRSRQKRQFMLEARRRSTRR
jgi:hypothetical protein